MKSKNAIKTLSILLFSLVFAGQLKAQDSTHVEQQTEVKSLNKIRLTLLGISYEREQKIDRLATLYFAGGIGASFAIQTEDYGLIAKTNTYFNISPNINAGFRRYYNFDKRNKKGRKTANNAANYYGLDVSAYFKPLLNNDYFGNGEIGITPQWGYQRSIGKKINFELMLGPTVRLGAFDPYFGVDGRIGFSFLL
ncbi:hypothetical protein ASE74_21825 [Pedobacter sp. Leaf216]|uniref:hypothetical protein n=1 Tax=Pedobacter sp. Leaf216 TaxID=1735684 RepID=UPI0006F757B2|nr:hypothetical protein [Pedobacter sp. Leaf216]KQM72724.1 hypothetical protein ASE74_21825 [Pedobacter sp. Leaf216]